MLVTPLVSGVEQASLVAQFQGRKPSTRLTEWSVRKNQPTAENCGYDQTVISLTPLIVEGHPMQAPLQAKNGSDAAQTDTATKVARTGVLADNRPEAPAQRKLADMMNNSPRVLQQRALSDVIHNSPRMVAQRHQMDALFGEAVKPQGDGAVRAEASPAQRKEKTNNTGLPNRLKSGIESLSGMSMDHVKVHFNSHKPALLQAHAYAQDSDIHVAPGQEKHLPHEAWHVVQQAQGRVAPTRQMKGGVNVNDDAGLEHEADIMGDLALGKSPGKNAHDSPQASVEAFARGRENPVQKRSSTVAAQPIVQRKIGAEDNVIFGLSGRSLEQIRLAIAAGYTTFDGADSYGGTILSLATAIDEAVAGGRTRDEFDIIYKVDHTPPAGLDAHIREVAARFDDYIDQVLIHKVTDAPQAALYQPILALLKTDGVISGLGAGDVGAGMDAQFANKDSFEINAIEIFNGADHEALVTRLNAADKPVFVYNVIGALKEFLGLGDLNPSHIQLSAMVLRIRELVPKAEPILSSGDQARQLANKNVFEIEEEDYAAVGTARDAIITATADAPEAAVSIAAMPEGLRDRMKGILFKDFDWAAENLFVNEADYGKARDQNLALFTPDERALRYQGVRADAAKNFSVQQLIEMLFDSHGNCHRVDGSNFLLRGFDWIE